jgi:hypothetical protein
MNMPAHGTIVASLVILSFATGPTTAADATADKVKISTLKAPPPKGAIVLFDGSNQDAWVSQMDRQWEKSDGPADWKITPEGWLEVVPGAGSLISKQRFGDFQLHLEFCLPEGEVNGGVFLQARYELGISASSQQGSRCGGFDNLNVKIRPTERADKPAGEWQTLDVEFRAPKFEGTRETKANARATVRFNGVTIHDNVELGPRRGAAKRLGDSPDGPIMLQDHGARYQFRNIWIVAPTELAR